MGQVILHTLVVIHHDRWTDRQGRNSKNRTEHPLGASELGVQTDHTAILIGDALEGAQDHLGLNRRGEHILTEKLTLQGCCLADNLCNLLKDRCLAMTTLKRLILLWRGA